MRGEKGRGREGKGRGRWRKAKIGGGREACPTWPLLDAAVALIFALCFVADS